jgi:hypothetical protein
MRNALYFLAGISIVRCRDQRLGADPEPIKDIGVVRTVTGGKVMYQT